MWGLFGRKKRREVEIAEPIAEDVQSSVTEESVAENVQSSATEEPVTEDVRPSVAEEPAAEMESPLPGHTVEIDPAAVVREKSETLGITPPAEFTGTQEEEKPKRHSEKSLEESSEESLEESAKIARDEMLKEEPKKSLYDWVKPKKKKSAKKPVIPKKTVQIGPVVIGSGLPKICVPIIGATGEEIAHATEEARAAAPDFVEWRGDFYEKILSRGDADTVLEQMAEILGDIPILFTFRNKREGGQRDLSPEEYQSVVRWAAGRPQVALVDIEGLHPEIDTEILVSEVHQAGKPVIASWHNFDRTPKKSEMLDVLDMLERTGADILKIAVMPEKPKDVLKLMDVTGEKNETTVCPLVTMSMGDLGRISRVSGTVTGSAVTFGSVGKGSAPGQIPAAELRRILAELS